MVLIVFSGIHFILAAYFITKNCFAKVIVSFVFTYIDCGYFVCFYRFSIIVISQLHSEVVTFSILARIILWMTYQRENDNKNPPKNVIFICLMSMFNTETEPFNIL